MNDTEKRRAKRRRKAGKQYRTWDLGNGIEQATLEAVSRAMGGLPPDLDLGGPRAQRHPDPATPPAAPAPGRRAVPGHAAAWDPDRLRDRHRAGIPRRGDVAALVMADRPGGPRGDRLENLRLLLRWCEPRDLVSQDIDGIPVGVLQSGVGCASALVLVPDELTLIFGVEPQCRHCADAGPAISMPLDTDRAFVGWLNDEFSTMDPNGLRARRVHARGGNASLPGAAPAPWLAADRHLVLGGVARPRFSCP